MLEHIRRYKTANATNEDIILTNCALYFSCTVLNAILTDKKLKLEKICQLSLRENQVALLVFCGSWEAEW
jgi:hypothetical protein